MKEALLSIIKDENRIITGPIDPQYLSDNLGRKKEQPKRLFFRYPQRKSAGLCVMPGKITCR